jgi:N-methylhydantoinase B
MRGYRLLAEEAELIMRSDRRAIRPYGLDGGLPGTPSWNLINPGPDQVILPVCPMRPTPMRQGDEFLHIQAGGGGYGDPLERDPSLVLTDLRNELITQPYAADVYGVVLAGDAVDRPATEARRALIRETGNATDYLDHFQDAIGFRT